MTISIKFFFSLSKLTLLIEFIRLHQNAIYYLNQNINQSRDALVEKSINLATETMYTKYKNYDFGKIILNLNEYSVPVGTITRNQVMNCFSHHIV